VLNSVVAISNVAVVNFIKSPFDIRI
jgi:hypothetical protein